MSQGQKPPSPVNMTRQRADALIQMAKVGAANWEQYIRAIVENPEATAEQLTTARLLDHDRAAALDGLVVLRRRYLGEDDVPLETTHTTLFDWTPDEEATNG